MPFLVIFIVIPFTELALFASVSEHIGIWTTLFLAFLTAILGGSIVKYQGFQTLFSMRESMDQGQMPVDEIFDGFCLVAAGALLITPGFLTDTIGFALLVPPARKALKAFLGKYMNWQVQSHTNKRYSHHDSGVIEGDYEEIKPDDKP